MHQGGWVGFEAEMVREIGMKAKKNEKRRWRGHGDTDGEKDRGHAAPASERRTNP